MVVQSQGDKVLPGELGISRLPLFLLDRKGTGGIVFVDEGMEGGGKLKAGTKVGGQVGQVHQNVQSISQTSLRGVCIDDAIGLVPMGTPRRQGGGRWVHEMLRTVRKPTVLGEGVL